MSWDFRVTRVVRVVDGDTVDLELDLGFYQRGTYRLRLIGIDTPEPGQPMADAATEFVKAWFDTRYLRPIRATTRKADSFGRWLADVYEPGESNLSSDLLIAGLAVPWKR